MTKPAETMSENFKTRCQKLLIWMNSISNKQLLREITLISKAEHLEQIKTSTPPPDLALPNIH